MTRENNDGNLWRLVMYLFESIESLAVWEAKIQQEHIENSLFEMLQSCRETVSPNQFKFRRADLLQHLIDQPEIPWIIFYQ
jgi:hypothetical protein